MLTLYKETAFQVKPPVPSNRVAVSIPRADGSYDRSKFSKKTAKGDRIATDDKTYAAEYLATSSSVFYRQSHHYPRSFLWRIVGQGKTLEISDADFARHEKDDEVKTVLALEFQDRISQRGISICEANKTHDIYIFVLSRKNEVFEIRLQTEYFSNPESIPKDIELWCSPIRASSLSIGKAFQINASNPHDVFVSFASGEVQHWKRAASDQPWSHTNYDDKTWGSSLFSMISRRTHPDIEFEEMRLAYNCAHAMARSGQYLFTACLNHTLRVWHLDTGKLVDSRDLLDQARDQNETLQLNPAEPGYVQLLEGGSRHQHILMTYSPLSGGQIKLWKVLNHLEDDIDLFNLQDAAPGSNLSLPDPDPTGNTVWSLAGLQVIFDKHTKEWQVWVLWRSHNYHKVYTLNFILDDIADRWEHGWVTVSTVIAKALPPPFTPAEAQEVMSKWVDHVFFPDRYSNAVIETALTQYSMALDAPLAAPDRNKSLKDRLSLLIASQVKLRKYDDSTTDYERFAVDTDQQWRQFWRILENLNESRYAPLSLAVDDVTGMVFLTMSGYCCAVRECSNLELLQLNQSDLDACKQLTRERWPYRKIAFSKDATAVQTVLTAAQKFYSSFPPELAADFAHTLDEDLFTIVEIDAPERIVNIFNQIDFANAVPDEVERDLLKDLSTIGGLNEVTNDIYDELLRLLSEHRIRHGKPHYVKTVFGEHLISVAVLEEIMALRQMLLSMLAVAIFLDPTENFDNAKYFDDLIARLKLQERNMWLGTHSRLSSDGNQISILDDIFSQSVRAQSADHHPMPYLLTQHIRDNLEWISGDSKLAPEDAAVYFQCNLLKHGDLQLAKDFLKFQPFTPWSTYIKGRLNLSLGEFKDAFGYLREAADGLAKGKAPGRLQEMSDGLLTAEDAACFFGGLPLYFSHVAYLFEIAKASDEAAAVSHLALDSLLSDDAEPVTNFKQTILLRLFNSELQGSHFSRACEALIQFSDPVLQRTATTELIDNMLNSSKSLMDTSNVVKQIQALPLASHPHLSIHVDHHIASLAKKQISIPSASGLWLSSTPVDYLSVLHALRLSKNNYRGAVSTLFDRLRIIQKSGRARSDPKGTSLRHALLALINAMTCVKDDEAYVIADAAEDPRITGTTSLKRKLAATTVSDDGERRKRQRVVITLDELRREYQKVLDRCSRLERADFEFNGDDEDDEDEEVEDGTWEGSKLVIDDSGVGEGLFSATLNSKSGAMDLT